MLRYAESCVDHRLQNFLLLSQAGKHAHKKKEDNKGREKQKEK